MTDTNDGVVSRLSPEPNSSPGAMDPALITHTRGSEVLAFLRTAPHNGRRAVMMDQLVVARAGQPLDVESSDASCLTIPGVGDCAWRSCVTALLLDAQPFRDCQVALGDETRLSTYVAQLKSSTFDCAMQLVTQRPLREPDYEKARQESNMDISPHQWQTVTHLHLDGLEASEKISGRERTVGWLRQHLSWLRDYELLQFRRPWFGLVSMVARRNIMIYEPVASGTSVGPSLQLSVGQEGLFVRGGADKQVALLYHSRHQPYQPISPACGSAQKHFDVLLGADTWRAAMKDYITRVSMTGKLTPLRGQLVDVPPPPAFLNPGPTQIFTGKGPARCPATKVCAAQILKRDAAGKRMRCSVKVTVGKFCGKHKPQNVLQRKLAKENKQWKGETKSSDEGGQKRRKPRPDARRKGAGELDDDDADRDEFDRAYWYVPKHVRRSPAFARLMRGPEDIAEETRQLWRERATFRAGIEKYGARYAEIHDDALSLSKTKRGKMPSSESMACMPRDQRNPENRARNGREKAAAEDAGIWIPGAFGGASDCYNRVRAFPTSAVCRLPQKPCSCQKCTPFSKRMCEKMTTGACGCSMCTQNGKTRTRICSACCADPQSHLTAYQWAWMRTAKGNFKVRKEVVVPNRIPEGMLPKHSSLQQLRV